MPPKKSIKPLASSNEPGEGVDARMSLKIPEGQRSTSKKKSLVGESFGKSPQDPDAEIHEGLARAASSTRLLKKKLKKSKDTGSKTGSTSSTRDIPPRKSGSKTSLLSKNGLEKKKSPRAHTPIMTSFEQRLRGFLNFGPTRVSDVENPEGDVPVPLCNKKTFMISLIILILLIIILVLIIFKFPEGGGGQGPGCNNITTTSMTTTTSTITSASPTMYTGPPTPVAGCNFGLPNLSNPYLVGGYCKNCFTSTPLRCIPDCCEKYYDPRNASQDQNRRICGDQC